MLLILFGICPSPNVVEVLTGRRRSDARGRDDRRRRLPLLALILAAGLGMSNAAQAAADALELLREGVSLRREGRDEEALQRFQRAYEIGHGGRALAQIGLAEQALGRWAVS